MEKIQVGRGASHKLTHNILEVGSTLEWEFVSTDYDIGFGLMLLTDKSKQELVIKML